MTLGELAAMSGTWPARIGAATEPITDSNARRLTEQAAAAAQSAHHSGRPPSLDGLGIVICAGGKYLPCLGVLLNVLRIDLKCSLPVEVWHLGTDEMPANWRAEIGRLPEIRIIDAAMVRRDYPHDRLNGWELKCYAMIHSRFAEVLLLDADCIPVRDPSYLAGLAEYRQTGAMFWPDEGRMTMERPVWELAGVEYQDEAEFESGEMLVDKYRCWSELLLANWFNENSGYWYSKFHGDKETFHLAWRKLGRAYSMCPPLRRSGSCMFHHDPKGQRVFQHGAGFSKWTLDRAPDLPAGYELADEVRRHLRQMAERINQTMTLGELATMAGTDKRPGEHG